MNIVKRELRSNVKSLLIWMVAIAFMVTVWMIEYNSFANSPEISEFMAALPQGLLGALGMNEFSLTSLNGFIGSISLYVYLLLGIQAVLLGSSIISKEERDKTGEFLFTLPITRVKVIVCKTIAAIINVLLLNLTTLTAMLLSTSTYDKSADFNTFVALSFLAIFIVQMIFLSIGMFVSSVSKNYKKSGNIAVSILMVNFIISSLIGMIESLKVIKFLSPFTYFESVYIQSNLALNPYYLLLSVMLIGFGIISTILIYPKRDLNI